MFLSKSCFNSDTVRSKPCPVSHSATAASVSIPTRCDQNLDYRLLRSHKCPVSIPTRCDQNSYIVITAVLFVAVSIPTRCDQNNTTLRFAPLAKAVSIPTRCDQNCSVEKVAGCLTKFQFRHGAIKTATYPSPAFLTVSFNSDTVRSKPFVLGFILGAVFSFNSDTVRSKRARCVFLQPGANAFQFRHGAIKTDYPVIFYIFQDVSIPTRCDQNMSSLFIEPDVSTVSIPTRCDQNC